MLPALNMFSPPSWRLWMWTLAVLVLVSEPPGVLQRCIFDEVQARARVVRAAPNEPRQIQQAQHLKQVEKAPPTPASSKPIRIRTWISRESNILPEEEKERMEAAVEEAVRMVSSLLSVVTRVHGSLVLSRDINQYCKFLWKNSSAANYNRCGRANSNYRAETCLDVTIPDDHLAGCDIYLEADSPHKTELRPEGAGLPDTDLLLYLHIQSTDKCRAETNVMAYAAHCRTDQYGRPVAGVVVLCRDRLTGATYRHQAVVQAVIHELFHVLGFSKELFHTWRDCSATSQEASSAVLGIGCSPRGRVAHSDGSGQMRIFSPSVISAMQEHLASADPELGGPLENLDAPLGRVSSHWESRVLQGSIMTAVLGDSTTVRIDAVTLAALQDTGWYTVDMSRAQSLVWGESEGATFGSLSTCQNESSTFFCSGSGFGCHYLHLHKGECQTDEYLEGCRMYKILKNGSECWRTENSRWSDVEKSSEEIFGLDSRCFFSSLIRQNQSQLFVSGSSVEGRCYRHRCTGPNRYQILVSGADWTDCPAGGRIQVTGYQGSVSCPDRKFCLYSDITPPPDEVHKAASVLSGPYESSTTRHIQTWSPVSVIVALSFISAACVLAAVLARYRKRFSRRTRIHIAPEDPSNL